MQFKSISDLLNVGLRILQIAIVATGTVAVIAVATAPDTAPAPLTEAARPTLNPEQAYNFQLTANANATSISQFQTAEARGERLPTPTPATLIRPTATPVPLGYPTPSPERLSLEGNLTYRTSQCRVKGNITLDTPPIYRFHVPGQYYYDTVTVEPERGERWFCSEEDAARNGFTKSRQ
jgi:hypothetical protein